MLALFLTKKGATYMINILLNNDYPLKGNLNYFEAYMFATTERHIAKHYIIERKYSFI